MKRKIRNYLSSKAKSDYSNLDRIFELYLNGDIKTLLSDYSGVGIYPTFNKLGKSIQLGGGGGGGYVAIDFLEDKYSVVIYSSGIEVEEVEKLFNEYDYRADFSLEELINEIDMEIKNHPMLNDTTSIEKKKKLYSRIAWISLCVPFVIIGILAILLINKDSIQLNKWFIIFLAVPVIVWLVFDAKSKRLK